MMCQWMDACVVLVGYTSGTTQLSIFSRALKKEHELLSVRPQPNCWSEPSCQRLARTVPGDAVRRDRSRVAAPLASPRRRRVGGGGYSASTDASALGPAAPGTQSAAYTAAMGLWAVPDGGYAASTPIWLLAVERGHHCLAERSAGGAAARRARAACMAVREGGRTFFLH